MTQDGEALLLTGAYGTGKSTVAGELADLLEKRGIHYAAIDLDWLTWYDAGEGLDHDDPTMMLRNLAAMLDNYLAVGVRCVVLAGSMREVARLRAMLSERDLRLRVVRLEVPLAEIARRLSTDPTTARADDLQVATEWLAGGVGEGLEDLVVANEGPVREVASSILDWLGWTTTFRPVRAASAAKAAGPSSSP